MRTPPFCGGLGLSYETTIGAIRHDGKEAPRSLMAAAAVTSIKNPGKAVAWVMWDDDGSPWTDTRSTAPLASIFVGMNKRPTTGVYVIPLPKREVVLAPGYRLMDCSYLDARGGM
ncbi:MAG TPA: hypothetical protein VIJ12_01920 [Candidatus Baltobacteraceae bacterium]